MMNCFDIDLLIVDDLLDIMEVCVLSLVKMGLWLLALGTDL